MLTLALILMGAAAVLLNSLLAPGRADPMGIFGLPPVRALSAPRVKAVAVSCRTVRPTAILSRSEAVPRCAHREAA